MRLFDYSCQTKYCFRDVTLNLNTLSWSSNKCNPSFSEVLASSEEVEESPVKTQEHRVDGQIATFGVNSPVPRKLNL